MLVLLKRNFVNHRGRFRHDANGPDRPVFIPDEFKDDLPADATIVQEVGGGATVYEPVEEVPSLDVLDGFRAMVESTDVETPESKKRAGGRPRKKDAKLKETSNG